MTYEEMIRNIGPKDLRKSVYYSQALFFIIAILLSVTLFRKQINWLSMFTLNLSEILLLGFLTACVVVGFELILFRYIPRKYMDDGGINEKIFTGVTIKQVFMIALIVAIAEELLFRGVIQTVFGYVIASSVFVLLHYRYIKKIVLFGLLVCISFFIGYLFKITNNLFVTIMFHFTVDFLLGIYISYRK